MTRYKLDIDTQSVIHNLRSDTTSYQNVDFSLLPLRAAKTIPEGRLDTTREYTFGKVIESTLSGGRKSLFLAVSAYPQKKGEGELLFPYADRSIAVSNSAYALSKQFGGSVYSINLIPDIKNAGKERLKEEVVEWPQQCMQTYIIGSDGKLQIFVIPSSRFGGPINNPLIPYKNTRERGFAFSHRPENKEKWEGHYKTFTLIE